jgi:hypothetical protein
LNCITGSHISSTLSADTKSSTTLPHFAGRPLPPSRASSSYIPEPSTLPVPLPSRQQQQRAAVTRCRRSDTQSVCSLTCGAAV